MLVICMEYPKKSLTSTITLYHMNFSFCK